MDYLDRETLEKVARIFYDPTMFLALPHTQKVINDSIHYNDTNATDPNVDEEPTLDPTLMTIHSTLIIMQVSFLMLTVGVGVTFDSVKSVLKSPKGLIIGLVCQLLLVPLVCFAVAHALQLEPALAIGMIVVASCPGGAPSNLFTLLTGGDLALSVCMTAFSSILVIGSMPLNVFLYIRSWSVNDTTVTPFINILIGVVFTWAPGLVGMLIRRRFPDKAQLLTRFGGVCALIVLVAVFLLNRFLFPSVFTLRWGVWYAALSMPLIAWLFAYGVSLLFVVERSQRKAIAFGSSLVNGGLAVALITLTYDGVNDLEDMLQFPMLYMAIQVLDAIVMTVFIRIFICARENRTICQKVYYSKRRTSTFVDSEAIEAAANKDHTSLPNGTANGVVNHGMTNGLPTVDRKSSSGFYIPRNPTELALSEMGEAGRERAFSV